MYTGQYVTTTDGQTHQVTDLWSPDGLAGAPRKRRRIRVTLRNVATGQVWDITDPTAEDLRPADQRPA